MRRILIAAALLLGPGTGIAHAAASCPAAPVPKIEFQPRSTAVTRDASLDTKGLAAKLGLPEDRVAYSHYEPSLSAGMSRKIQQTTMPGGTTVCASLEEVVFQLGYKRKLYIASELASNACVADAVAARNDERIRREDEALAKFGATVEATYLATVKSIGTQTGSTPEEAQKPIIEKLRSIMTDSVLPAFEKENAEALASIKPDDSPLPTCDGATKEILGRINEQRKS
jgi:hypothetical protein